MGLEGQRGNVRSPSLQKTTSIQTRPAATWELFCLFILLWFHLSVFLSFVSFRSSSLLFLPFDFCISSSHTNTLLLALAASCPFSCPLLPFLLFSRLCPSHSLLASDWSFSHQTHTHTHTPTHTHTSTHTHARTPVVSTSVSLLQRLSALKVQGLASVISPPVSLHAVGVMAGLRLAAAMRCLLLILIIVAGGMQAGLRWILLVSQGVCAKTAQVLYRQSYRIGSRPNHSSD